MMRSSTTAEPFPVVEYLAPSVSRPVRSPDHSRVPCHSPVSPRIRSSIADAGVLASAAMKIIARVSSATRIGDKLAPVQRAVCNGVASIVLASPSHALAPFLALCGTLVTSGGDRHAPADVLRRHPAAGDAALARRRAGPGPQPLTDLQ